ncbi:septation protein SepH [Jannaschia sp. R86511]|uniref:septation protein SepH n=1 Tax=Jannaschia sp. R86511 TaxID=3093853 RepID=UPI0036D39611
MDTLRLVEVTGDGDLVLMTGDGRRFSLAVDEQVRSAVRRSRNGTHVTPASDRPGPREVQSRIRSGADAQQVAQQTGLDVDYVRRFEGPVLAERAHVAELARGTAVDRGGDPGLTLERVVLEVLTGEGHDVDDIAWDSRRSDGTRWEVLVVTGTASARSEATWSFDTGTRSLEPVDAEAERLTGVERRRRLSAVRDTVFDVERPAATAPRGGTVDLLDALARQRGRRPTPPAAGHAGGTADPGDSGEAGRPREGVDHATESRDHGDQGRDTDSDGTDSDADRAGTTDHDGPAPGQTTAGTDAAGDPAGPGLRTAPTPPDDRDVSASVASIEPDLLSELDLDPSTGPAGGSPSARSAPAPSSAGSSRPTALTGPPRVPPPAPGVAGERRSRRRRAAVPSWDEIVFGAKREDG